MDVAEIFLLHLELELSEGLYKGHALDVPHCASQLLTQNQLRAHCCINDDTNLDNKECHHLH